MKKLLKWKSKIGSMVLKSMSFGAALIFLIAQNGDTCFIWNYQPKAPRKSNKFSIKDV